MNIEANEQIGLGQKALYDVYIKEKARQNDFIDYGLIDNLHELKNVSYGKPNKQRNLEPSMYEILTGGYEHPQEQAQNFQTAIPDFQSMTEQEIMEYKEALARKEIAKSKWITETRDNFRKFTDEPNENTYYIGNQMVEPRNFANDIGTHYKTIYKKDYGEEDLENEGEDYKEAEPEPEEDQAEEVKEKKPKKNRIKSKSPGSRISERKKTPKKKRKKDFNKWIFERNKAKYGQDLLEKDNLTKKEKEELKQLEKEISVSRWKADTHLKSLHGKPIFHAFGKGNTNPTVGGIVYGNYMLTHNIHPHAGDNKPKYQQVYDSAHDKAFANGKPELLPTRILVKPDEMSKEQLEELKERNPIMPDKPSREQNREIKKLNLMNEV